MHPRTSLALVLTLALSALAFGQEESGTTAPPDAAGDMGGTEVESEGVDTAWRGPLESRNQMPLALLFVYMTAERAGALDRGALDFDVLFDYSNIIQEQQTEDEAELLRFDLEYLRARIAMRRGFGGGIEAGFSLPFYVYYGGFLDSFVSSFHERFGLPNVLRGQTEYGLVDYQLRQGGKTILDGRESTSSVGDLSLDVKKTVFSNGRRALALRGRLKLPTGSPDRLSGSGATDFGLGVAFDRIGDRFGFYAGANYQFLGASERFETRDFFSFMVGADWRFKPHLAALVQFDSMGPPLRGELSVLNSSGRQLALGLRWRHSERFVYEWRLVEDLSSFSPDFTFAFGVKMGFHGPSQ